MPCSSSSAAVISTSLRAVREKLTKLCFVSGYLAGWVPNVGKEEMVLVKSRECRHLQPTKNRVSLLPNTRWKSNFLGESVEHCFVQLHTPSCLNCAVACLKLCLDNNLKLRRAFGDSLTPGPWMYHRSMAGGYAARTGSIPAWPHRFFL